jgi:hypothetical protein
MGSFRQNPAVCTHFLKQGSLGLPGLPRLTKSHTRPAAIFIDELDAGGFKGMPQRSFIPRSAVVNKAAWTSCSATFADGKLGGWQRRGKLSPPAFLQHAQLTVGSRRMVNSICPSGS